jgi:ketosteroid isomerase-like protein
MTEPTQNDSAEAKKAIFRRLVEIYTEADVDALDEFISPDYVGHTSAGTRDLAEFRQSILNFHALFEYGRGAFTVEDQFVEGDKVATRMTAHVRMRETGEPVTLLGINLAIVRDGKLVEEWNTWEQAQSPQSLSMKGVSPST